MDEHRVEPLEIGAREQLRLILRSCAAVDGPKGGDREGERGRLAVLSGVSLLLLLLEMARKSVARVRKGNVKNRLATATKRASAVWMKWGRSVDALVIHAPGTIKGAVRGVTLADECADGGQLGCLHRLVLLAVLVVLLRRHKREGGEGRCVAIVAIAVAVLVLKVGRRKGDTGRRVREREGGGIAVGIKAGGLELLLVARIEADARGWRRGRGRRRWRGREGRRR